MRNTLLGLIICFCALSCTSEQRRIRFEFNVDQSTSIFGNSKSNNSEGVVTYLQKQINRLENDGFYGETFVDVAITTTGQTSRRKTWSFEMPVIKPHLLSDIKYPENRDSLLQKVETRLTTELQRPKQDQYTYLASALKNSLERAESYDMTTLIFFTDGRQDNGLIKFAEEFSDTNYKFDRIKSQIEMFEPKNGLSNTNLIFVHESIHEDPIQELSYEFWKYAYQDIVSSIEILPTL